MGPGRGAGPLPLGLADSASTPLLRGPQGHSAGPEREVKIGFPRVSLTLITAVPTPIPGLEVQCHPRPCLEGLCLGAAQRKFHFYESGFVLFCVTLCLVDSAGLELCEISPTASAVNGSTLFPRLRGSPRATGSKLDLGGKRSGFSLGFKFQLHSWLVARLQRAPYLFLASVPQ